MKGSGLVSPTKRGEPFDRVKRGGRRKNIITIHANCTENCTDIHAHYTLVTKGKAGSENFIISMGKDGIQMLCHSEIFCKLRKKFCVWTRLQSREQCGQN